jgi:hypothetical protein
MDFLTAIKKSQWVKRISWPGWILVKDGKIGGNLSNITKADVLANDWISYQYIEDDSELDDASVRFNLLELS